MTLVFSELDATEEDRLVARSVEVGAAEEVAASATAQLATAFGEARGTGWAEDGVMFAVDRAG
jgi:hypothetical protein